MTLEISPIGLIITFVLWLVIGLTVVHPTWKRLRNRRHGWWIVGPMIVAVLILPFADELWISWHFAQACRDAGVHVYRKVEVDGFVDDTSRSSRASVPTGPWNFDPKSLADWDARGYRFQENMLKDGGVVHLDRTESGIVATVYEHPTARYSFRYADPEHVVPAGFQMEKIERQVVDAVTDQVIAREIIYGRYPGFIEGLWVRFFGRGLTQCPDPGKGPPIVHLPYAALVPPSNR